MRTKIDCDDGSAQPLGYVTPDGELEVREYVDESGVLQRGYCETELGQVQRWIRQAPDLYALYIALVEEKQHTWNTCPLCSRKWKDEKLTPGQTKVCAECRPRLYELMFPPVHGEDDV